MSRPTPPLRENRILARRCRAGLGGFTLIEQLMVIAIIGILATFILPSVVSISKGSNLTVAGQIVCDQLAQARQEAVSRNRDMEVRFYQWADSDATQWQAMQLLRIDQSESGPVTVASSKITLLPNGIVITTLNSLSPLITSAPRSGSVQIPGHGTASYRAFRFRANGSVETAVGTTNFLTLLAGSDSADTLKNYYTIQINVLTGKVSVFRP